MPATASKSLRLHPSIISTRPPIDADGTFTLICGDLMYGLHVLLTFLSRTNNDNYGDQDDLLRLKKAKMKTTLGKIRAIIEPSPPLTAALANHLLYHDKNKRSLPKIANFDGVLSAAGVDIDPKELADIIDEVLSLRDDVGPGCMDTLEKLLRDKLTSVSEHVLQEIKNENPKDEIVNECNTYIGLVDSARKAFGVNAVWIRLQQAAAASVGKISTCKVITGLIVNCSLKYKDADRVMPTHLEESAIAANGLRSIAEDCGYDLGPTTRVLSGVRVSMLSCKQTSRNQSIPYAL